MGYTLIGYPSRVHKRKKHARQPRQICLSASRFESCDQSSVSRGANDELERPTKLFKTPRSLQDLPIEVIQRIFAFTQDVGLMRSLNRFFYHHLRLTDSLLGDMFWTYVYDPVADGLGDRFHCPRDLVMVSGEIFDNEAVLRFLNRNDDILYKVWAFVEEEFVNHRLDESETESAILRLLDSTTGMFRGDYPPSFYHEMGRYFTQETLLRALTRFFTLRRPHELAAKLFYWIFTSCTAYVKNYGDLFNVLRLLESMSEDSAAESWERAMPLETLVKVLFDSDRPVELQSYADDIVVNSLDSGDNFTIGGDSRFDGPVDSKIRILEQIVQFSYTNESALDSLSDYNLWVTLRKQSNMAVIELIEEYGGRPQFQLFL